MQTIITVTAELVAILVSALNLGTQNEDVGWGEGIYYCAVGSNSGLCTSDRACSLHFLLMLKYSLCYTMVCFFYVETVVFTEMKTDTAFC